MKHFDKGFIITHHTFYEYDAPIFFEPHLLRFAVRKNPHIRSKAHAIKIQPNPAVSTEMIDAEDNHVLSVSFQYDEAHEAVLYAALREIQVSSALAALNKSLLKECHYDTIQYLILLTNTIHEQYQKIHRHDGPPLMPEVLEKAKKGSCRDLAYLQMALGRNSGLACRFVSGYVLDETIEKDFELHAWVEVFLPGAGWIGFDPSTGLAVDSRYVPVACSAFPQNTLPVSGNFRGSASSKLSTKITVEKLSDC